MQYAWYEIVGMGMLVGIVCFIVFNALEIGLDWWLARRIEAELDEMNKTAPVEDDRG